MKGVITAKTLDDALMAFIKRIVEEAYQAERSKDIVPTFIKVSR
jgi:hypothetical protein